VIIICAAAILFVLLWQCRVNLPVAPNWSFMPKIVANYWNWLDDWQMKRCPDLTPDNYFLGDEPVPAFGADGDLIFQPECGEAAITFTPESAPAGSTFTISLDHFTPDSTLKSCWYFPSTKLENCADLDTDEDGHRDTAYFSDANSPTGTYLMEVEDECGMVRKEFVVE